MWEWLTTKEGNVALGALLGVGGTLISQTFIGFLGVGKELWFARRKRRWDARHLALETILLLDDFVGQCYGAAVDDPEFDPKDNTKFVFRNPLPKLVLPDSASWRLLEPKLMEEIMWLPSRFNNMRQGLNSLDRYPPDFDDYFEHRREGYSRLGLRALGLIHRLCAEYGIEAPDRPEHYNPRETFKQTIEEMERFWKRRQESAREMWEGLETKSPA